MARTREEHIASFVFEVTESDDVGMFAVAGCGTELLQLTGEELRAFVQDALTAILRHGGRAVVSSGNGWQELFSANDPEGQAKQLVHTWMVEKDPAQLGMDGPWFTTNPSWRAPS